jgi:hypothetical protein
MGAMRAAKGIRTVFFSSHSGTVPYCIKSWNEYSLTGKLLHVTHYSNMISTNSSNHDNSKRPFRFVVTGFGPFGGVPVSFVQGMNGVLQI